MSFVDGIRMAACFLYALTPYSALYLFSRRKEKALDFEDILLACIWGIAGFILVALPIVSVSLNLYSIVHAAVCVPALVWLTPALRRHFCIASRFHWAAAAILLLAFLVRLAPFLPHDNWFGGGDMRFHNILAESIIVGDALPRTWEPFAEIAVNYPLGGHLLAAFVSVHSLLPVHTVLNALLCLCGGLSSALIYFLALRLFENKSAATASALSYGFIALVGSLDYIRWGGLPNALAMLLLLLFVTEVLKACELEEADVLRSMVPALVAAAIVLTHHYSALAMFLLVGSIIILTPLRAVAKSGLMNSLAGLLLALLILRSGGPLPGSDVGKTSVFMFYEHPITLREVLVSMNLPFAVVSIAGVCAILRNGIPRKLSLLTAWTTGYFAAFVFLEYIYRLAVFVISDGQHFFTALTPSRLIADLAYPLSLSVGALTVYNPVARYRTYFAAVLCSLGLTSCLLFFLSLQGPGGIPGSSAAIEWISANVPEDAIVVGSLPHLEYRSWRRTSSPPIPASEARNHPELLRQRSMTSVAQWHAYAESRGLECYYVLSADAHSVPPGLTALHSSGGISVCIVGAAP